MRLSLLFRVIADLFNQPKTVFLICTSVLGISFVMDGSLYRLYGFYMQEDSLRTQIAATENELESLQKKVAEAHGPQFLERLAREKFNMVGEDELIFVFDE